MIDTRMVRMAIILVAALVGMMLPGVVLEIVHGPSSGDPAVATAALAAEEHGAAMHETAADAEEPLPEGEESGGMHLPTVVTLLEAGFGERPWVVFLARNEDILYSWFVVAFLGIVFGGVVRKLTAQPGRAQAVAEMVVESLDGLISGLLGPAGRKYLPFLGTLFLYIWCMNLSGLIPLGHAPTTSINMTAALAIIVFLYVQFDGLRNLGLIGYLDHLAGNPRGFVGWALVPLMFPLHVIGELAKPLSLALRLFGNVTGEDILIAAFVGLGAASLAFTHLPIGIPYQVPLIFMAVLFSTIQALIFTLLSAAYFLMVQPHVEEEGGH
jgi:F-type H+-transporting ATPase subunit a